VTKLIRTLCVAGLLLSAASFADAQVSIGIRIGPPPRPRVERQVVAPARGYVWVPGYWYPTGNHYKWHAGYWTLPPYAGATWIAPRYETDQFYEGYWQTPRGQFAHNHKWDKERNRDGDRDRDDRDRDRDGDRR
jgi:hypothetical protein